jgi:putative DNA primase/helicase
MHKLVKRIPAPILQEFKSYETLADYYCNWESALQEDKINQCITLYHCKEGQQFESQNVMPIDIDHIDTDRLQEYRDAVQAAIGVNKEDFITVFTGHGIHCIVGLKDSLGFNEIKSGSKLKKMYQRICVQIGEELEKRSLTCMHGNKKYVLDDGIFAPVRTTRLIGSINRKKDFPDVEVTLLGGSLQYNFSIKDMHKEDEDSDNIINKQMTSFYDTAEVTKSCKFLEYCRTNPEKTDYDQWCAMISILSKLENGEKLCHDYSKLHSKYDPEKTDAKIQSGFKKGYSCKRIHEKFEGCTSCPHRNSVRFPLEIKGDEYIPTKDSYFRKILQKGKSPIEIMDAVKFLPIKTGGFYHSSKSNNCYIYNDKTHKWIEITSDELSNIFFQMTNWDSKIFDFREFFNMAKARYIQDDSPSEYSNKINLNNGVFDIEKMALLPHAKEHYFHDCLPYNYDPSAICPGWLKFLDEVMEGDPGMIRLLQEYAAYCIFYPKLSLSKMMFLIGEGQNGKGVFTNILKELIGTFQTVTSDLDILSDKQSTERLRFKKLFLCNEVEFGQKLELSKFKVLVEGDSIDCNPKYRKHYDFPNTAKLIVSCNSLPVLKENGNATRRRVIVCNFDRIFSDEEKNINLTDELKEELSGIFNWAIQGYLELSKRNSFIIPKKAQVALAHYLEDEEKDFKTVFCRENLELAEGEELKIKEIFSACINFYAENGFNSKFLNSRNLSIAVRKTFKLGESHCRKENGVVHKVIKGIRFKLDRDNKPDF